MTEAEDEAYLEGFNDATQGKDCKASSHEYVEGFNRGKDIMRGWPPHFTPTQPPKLPFNGGKFDKKQP
jgi:hypothetical protein